MKIGDDIHTSLSERPVGDGWIGGLGARAGRKAAAASLWLILGGAISQHDQLPSHSKDSRQSHPP